MLTTMKQPIQLAPSYLIWHKDVPLKVIIFVWRLIWNRLPTKDNLRNRGILSHENHLCVGGCRLEETSHHLFLSCPIFGSVWHHLRRWLGILGVDHMCLSDHFLQFGYLRSGYRRIRSTLILIWLACIWVLWKERNNKIFNKAMSIDEIVNKVKLSSFWWLKAKHVNFAFSYHNWWLTQMECLDIGM